MNRTALYPGIITVGDVEKFCDEYGLTISINYQETNKYKEGTIIAQNRAKGSNIIKGSTFKITVAKKVTEVEKPKEEENNATDQTTNTQTTNTQTTP